MGAVMACKGSLRQLLEILGHYEKLERSTGYHYLDYRDFTDYLMFYETFVDEEEGVEYYWNYLKQLGILAEIEGTHYLDMGRLCLFCSVHKIDIFVACTEAMDEYGLSREEGKVLGFIRDTGRLGASIQKIRRRSMEAKIDPDEVPRIIDRLTALGLILRTEDEFLRAADWRKYLGEVHGGMQRGKSRDNVFKKDRKYVLKLISDRGIRGASYENLLISCRERGIKSDELKDILKDLLSTADIYEVSGIYKKVWIGKSSWCKGCGRSESWGDKVLGFIRNTGRLGASEQKIRRLSNEAGLDPWEVPDIIDRLLSLGLVLRTEDDFLRAIPRLRCRRSVCRNGSGKSVSAEDRKFVLKLIYGSWPRGVTFEDLLRKCTVRLIASDRLRDILEDLSGRSLICISDGRYQGAWTGKNPVEINQNDGAESFDEDAIGWPTKAAEQGYPEAVQALETIHKAEEKCRGEW